MEQIRVLIAILGMDQHELGAITVSRMLRDAGMEVIYAGRFNLPPMIVKMALEETVDVIGLSCHSWEYLFYVPELIYSLSAQNLHIPVVVGGSVITNSDKENLIAQGVALAFGPSSSSEEIVKSLSEIAKKDKKCVEPNTYATKTVS